MQNDSNNRTINRVILTDRSRLELNGLKEVKSFDSEEVRLITDQGGVIIRGNGLHINRISLKTGELELDGRIDSFVYKQKKYKPSFFERIFG